MTSICKIIALLGAILLLGTAGASDFSGLTMTRTITQSLIGLGLICIGFRGAAAAERREEE